MDAPHEHTHKRYLLSPTCPLYTLAASVAFVLNLATISLIQRTSALTLNVAGVIKDLVCLPGQTI